MPRAEDPLGQPRCRANLRRERTPAFGIPIFSFLENHLRAIGDLRSAIGKIRRGLDSRFKWIRVVAIS
jgi:hypothetical protein